MFSCLSSNAYSLLADIYEPVDVQNQNTGVVNKEWRLKETIPCMTKSQISSGIDRNSASTTSGQKIIQTTENIKLRSKKSISTAYRIVEIRNDYGPIWIEDRILNSQGGFGDNGSTIFESKGSIPILDHNGNVIEFETTISRQDIQSITLYVETP